MRCAAVLLTVTASLAAASSAQAHVRIRPLSPGIVAGLGSAANNAQAPFASTASASDPLTPAQIRRAYALPASGARGQKIAVITAWDDPHAQADLNAFDSDQNLRPCTTANGCFRKLNQDGKPSPLPVDDPTGGMWRTESAVGIETVHGVCQSCSIMLVEALGADRSSFSTAVKAAAAAGATVIVTTFIVGEDPTFDRMYAPDYVHSKAVIVSAVGDGQGTYGYTGAANFPSSLPSVLAVGGTRLVRGPKGSYGREEAWTGTVSGCSLFEKAPSWQKSATASMDCQTWRGVADISAMADPGALVHITGSGQPGGPWFAATGTSLAAPIIAGAIGLAGSEGSRETQLLYQRAKSDPGAFHDITTGVNAPGCKTRVCKAMRGFDGPTGLGTPFGLAAFLPSGGQIAQSRPNVTVTAKSNKLRADRSWKLHPAISNSNPFAIAGQLVIKGTVRVNGHRRTVTFATLKLALGPLAQSMPAIAVARSQRALLKRLGHAPVTVRLLVHGPVGRAATVSKKLTLYAAP